MDKDNCTIHSEEASAKNGNFRNILLTCLGILVLLVGFSVYLFKFFNVGYALKIAANFIYPSVDKLASQGGRTNILIMGIGGAGHDGEDLTDTMLVVSVSLTRPDLAIISVPRDIWIPEIRAKINAAYYWGDKNTPYFSNESFPGGKIGFVKSITQEVLGVPINYGVVLDFSAFEKIINDVGGIEVNVERGFTDRLYPRSGRENDLCNGDPTFACRYETVTFSPGTQQMDGAMALKFVRSRHAEGVEGGDLAREARQQKVIDAIGQKILTREVLLNPQTDLRLWGDLNNSLIRDIDDPTAAILARLIFNSRNSIGRFTIPDKLLFTPPASRIYDWQEVLIPSLGNGKWDAIHAWVSQILK